MKTPSEKEVKRSKNKKNFGCIAFQKLSEDTLRERKILMGVVFRNQVKTPSKKEVKHSKKKKILDA